jgi:SAM-dependent methyltransferase
MYAVLGNLAVVDDPRPASLSGPEFFDFDVAAVGGGLHHLEHAELAVTRLAERLRPGGVFFIWDFLTHDVDPAYAAHGVVHHGFSEEQVRTMFVRAGE